MRHTPTYTTVVILLSCTLTRADVLNVPGQFPTIQTAINAAQTGDEVVIADGVYIGTGNRNISFQGKSITVRSANGAGNCVIDGEGTYRGFVFQSGEEPDAILQGLTVRNCFAETAAAVLVTNFSHPTFVDCRFTENVASGPVGGLKIENGSDMVLMGCEFTNNTAIAAGAMLVIDSNVTVLNCKFINNTVNSIAGGVISGFGTAIGINCFLSQNTTTSHTGGWAHSSAGMFINCAFSRNSGSVAGGLYIGDADTAVINCTFSNNTTNGVTTDGDISPTVINSVFWGNSPQQIGSDPAFPPGSPSVYYSDVQDGWDGDGANNIAADPLFVQAGTDNVRLAFGSPCVDAGNNESLPADEFDLDGDGVTDEQIPVDLDGLDRVQSQVVDMGAYEGEYEALPPAAVIEDLDPGELGVLIPCGGEFDFLENAVVLVINLSGPEDAIFMVTCIAADLYPLAGGFSELGNILRTASSLKDGQFLLRVFMPFDDSMLSGLDPLSLNALWYEQSGGNWHLAVANNTQNSPGYDSPIGDRIAVENSENDYVLSTELGDYGVFWNPDLQQGFVWANTDRLGDYALGASLCLSECFPDGGDGVIDIDDLLSLISAWEEGTNALCDYDGDGVPGMSDLLALIASWGQCTGAGGVTPLAGDPHLRFGPCARQHACMSDLDGDGAVRLEDMIILLAAWGDCEGCAEDLNCDGTVNRLDLELMHN